MKINDPCYQCKDRDVGCHSTCEQYLEWSGKVRKKRVAITKEKTKEALIVGHIVDTINKRRKSK